MMTANEEIFEEIWVSSNYAAVFCTEEEKEQYLHSLSSKKFLPRGMSVVFIRRILFRIYTINEFVNA